MIDYIKNWCDYCNLPIDAFNALKLGYEKLTENEEDKKVIYDFVSEYEKSKDIDFTLLRERVKNISLKVGIHEYTGYAVTYLLLTPALKKHYEKLGLTEEIYNESIKDVSFHMRSTYLCNNVWGTYTAWHNLIYKAEVLGFGRLQFQPIKANFDYEDGDAKIINGETYILHTHIPRTTTSLDYDECEKSIEKAIKFFKNTLFNNGNVYFECQSWLLFKEHEKMLKPTSNILKFMNRFTIINNGYYENYNELWRLFDMNYTGNPDDFPTDSSLRKEYVNLLKQGGKTGWGRGIFYRK